MKYAVISSDRNPDYSFFCPLTSTIWRAQGYRPLLFLVGTAEEWLADPRLRLSLERSREIGAVIHFVPELEGVRSSTVAQCARIVASAAPGLNDDDILITSDMDMWPLGPWVGGNVDESKRLHLYYANAYAGTDYVHFPMCYQMASVLTWKALTMRCPLGIVLSEVPAESDAAWNWDERFLGKIIEAWSDYPKNIQFIDRTFVEGEWRLDRSAWESVASLKGIADAHLLRPGFTEANWSRIRPIFEMAMQNEKLTAWADDYRAKWMEAS